MKTLDKMSKDERSLLLFFESAAVEYGGHLDTKHMNKDDHMIAEEWAKSGFIKFGRLASECVTSTRNYWVVLHDDAWKVAHEERMARCKRLWNSRNWHTTEEKRAS